MPGYLVPEVGENLTEMAGGEDQGPVTLFTKLGRHHSSAF